MSIFGLICFVCEIIFDDLESEGLWFYDPQRTGCDIGASPTKIRFWPEVVFTRTWHSRIKPQQSFLFFLLFRLQQPMSDSIGMLCCLSRNFKYFAQSPSTSKYPQLSTLHVLPLTCKLTQFRSSIRQGDHHNSGIIVTFKLWPVTSASRRKQNQTLWTL